MDVVITRGELEERLEKLAVYSVLNDLSFIAQMWKSGGLVHRIRAMGFAAETGVRHIKEDQTPIKMDTPFGEMRVLDRKMYDDTLEWLYPFVQLRIYLP